MSVKEQEQFWDSMAVGDSDAGVIDPADKKNLKNGYIRFLRNHYFCNEIENLPPDSLVLDFGCGTGLVTQVLSDKGYPAVGVDISEKLLTYGKSVRPGLNLLKIDGEKLPFEDGAFARIMVYVVFNYVEDDRALAHLLAEMNRVLQPDGKIVAIEQTLKYRTSVDSENKTLRTQQEYLRQFESSNFLVRKHKTVRFGRFPTTYLVRYGLLPKFSWGLLRRIEAIAGSMFTTSRFSYTDTLFIAEKDS